MEHKLKNTRLVFFHTEVVLGNDGRGILPVLCINLAVTGVTLTTAGLDTPLGLYVLVYPLGRISEIGHG